MVALAYGCHSDIIEDCLAAPSDAELLASMASRLALVERALLAAKRETVEKVINPLSVSDGGWWGLWLPPVSRTVTSATWRAVFLL